MKINLAPAVLLLTGVAIFGADNSAPAEKTFDAPYGLKVSVKMIGPYSEPADLKIICLFKNVSKSEKLAQNFTVEDFVIEAGPPYFEGAAKQVEEGIESIATQLAQRNAAPYSSTKMR
jgi:hypothetical protein